MLFLNLAIRPFIVLLLLLSAVVTASPTANDYGALPTMQMVAISPNGDLIAYRKVADGQDAVVVTSMSQKKVLLALDVSNVQPRTMSFFNNNQLLMVASEYRRVEGFRGKFDLSTAFVLNIDDKKTRQLLTPGEKILAGQTGLGNVVGVSPDGRYAYMPAWSDVDNLFPDSVYNLYKVDLTRRNLSVATQGSQKARDFFLDKEGNTVAIEEYDERGEKHKILAKHGSKWVEIFTEETEIRNKSFVGLTADFSSLVFLERDDKTDKNSYNLMKLADGAITRSIFARDDADVLGTITDIQRVVYGVRYSGFTPSYKFFDPAIDQRVKDIVAQFPDHSVFLSDWSPDFKHIVVNVEGSNYADDYFLFSSNQSPVFLTTGRPQIKTDDINPLGRVTFSARDNLRIPTLLTIPRSKAGDMKNLPAIIYPHGGPAAHDIVGFDYFAQALAAQGYLVIQPQFRGSTGFGYKHRDAGLGEWGKKMQDDLSDAVAFFVKKGIIDPKKVCIVGGSYGGYAALAGGAFTPDLYKCVVSINGVSDLNDMLAYDKNHYGKDSEVTAYWKMQLANSTVDKAELEKVSPAKFAQQFTAPVLLIHSENDKIVIPDQSQDMLKALQKHKKPVQFVPLEGDDHYLLKGATRTQAVTEVVKFVNQHLGGGAAPVAAPIADAALPAGAAAQSK